MNQQIQLVLIFIAVICGMVSAGYLYQSADIFVNLLRKPLRLISSGMLVITAGVLLAAFISYESQLGVVYLVYGVPISAFFYVFYIIGSVLILLGARQFTYHPVK
jgi:C4-dicarboxylate transporter